MTSALDCFLEDECDAGLAAHLRAEVAAAEGHGYDRFEFNLFDVELYYGENRVTVAQAMPLGYEDVEIRLDEFLKAISDVPAGSRMPGRPRRVIIPPAPSSDLPRRSCCGS